jgi:hypothetical protein
LPDFWSATAIQHGAQNDPDLQAKLIERAKAAQKQ